MGAWGIEGFGMFRFRGFSLTIEASGIRGFWRLVRFQRVGMQDLEFSETGRVAPNLADRFLETLLVRLLQGRRVWAASGLTQIDKPPPSNRDYIRDPIIYTGP